MITFSFWNFESFNSISQVIELLEENKKVDINIDEKQWTHKAPVSEFKDIDGYGINSIKNVSFNNKNIKFIYFEGFAERPVHKNSWLDENGIIKERADLINDYKCNIILFEYNLSVHGVFFRAKSTAERIIKYIFKNEIWGNITEKLFGINEDLFYWIFQRVKDYSDEPLYRNSDMNISGLQSYIGKTKDNVNAVRGEGDRIAAMLGTIAFLFNNESLKAVRPEIQYKGNKILVEMSLVGTFKLWDSKYVVVGDLVDTDELTQLFKMVIYVSLELIPKLIECYKMNVVEKQWSPQMKLYFLKTLGNEIMQKVNVELKTIKEQINKEGLIENQEYENEDFEQEIENFIEEIDEELLE